jgi:uncharacterized protein (TIGR03067 family)
MSAKLITLTAAVLALGVAEDANDKDLAKMQGDWVVVSMVRDGEKIPDDDAQVYFRTVKGREYTVSRFSKVAGRGTITIDATKRPRTIDALPANAPNGKPLLGIYEFEGDRFKVCFAPPGKDRPTDFSASEGSGHTLTVWEPEKK